MREYWDTMKPNKKIDHRAQSKSRLIKFLFPFSLLSLVCCRPRFVLLYQSSTQILTMFRQSRNKKEKILFLASWIILYTLTVSLLIVAWPFVVLHSFQPFQVQWTNKKKKKHRFLQFIDTIELITVYVSVPEQDAISTRDLVGRHGSLHLIFGLWFTVFGWWKDKDHPALLDVRNIGHFTRVVYR